MAKKIICSDSEIEQFVTGVRSNLANKKFQTDSVHLKFSPKKDERRAGLLFTAKAWLKTAALVKSFSTEIQWHGLVTRISENSFLIEDILLFPHEASAASVISDQKEYEEWLDGLDDETFNRNRFHGHSHVNMGVHPSPIDDAFRQSILNNFGTPAAGDDYFYIFLILNKSGEHSGQIFDLTNNALYETDEIAIDIITEDDVFLSEFTAEAKKLAREAPVYVPPQTAKGVQTHNTGKNSGKKDKKIKDTGAYDDYLYDLCGGYYGGHWN